MDRANFSNFGDEVDVVAPGVDILSTYPVSRYAKLSGTSMTIPIVAGVIALLQSYCRKVGIKATPKVVLQMIQECSVDLGTDDDDDLFGNGLINVHKLIKG